MTNHPAKNFILALLIKGLNVDGVWSEMEKLGLLLLSRQDIQELSESLPEFKSDQARRNYAKKLKILDAVLETSRFKKILDLVRRHRTLLESLLLIYEDDVASVRADFAQTIGMDLDEKLLKKYIHYFWCPDVVNNPAALKAYINACEEDRASLYKFSLLGERELVLFKQGYQLLINSDEHILRDIANIAFLRFKELSYSKNTPDLAKNAAYWGGLSISAIKERRELQSHDNDIKVMLEELGGIKYSDEPKPLKDDIIKGEIIDIKALPNKK